MVGLPNQGICRGVPCAARMNSISRTAAAGAEFLGAYGLAATMNAFGISRCTLYGWKKTKGNTVALNNQS